MNTFILLATIIASYIFGVMSGVIMMRKTNIKSSDKFRKEMLTLQRKQSLAKTKKNKTSRPLSKKKVYNLNDDRLPGGFGTFGTGNSNGPSNTIEESTYPINS